MSDDKNPIEQAVDQAMDAFVYAPIGLVFDGPALFPKLVERGRNQVQAARIMGQMAVQMGQTEAEKRASRTEGPLRDALVAMGVVKPAARPEPATAAPAQPAPAAKKVLRPRKATKKAAKGATKRATTRKATSSAPAASSLGIPDYDSLSASQVVKRLQGMASGDLDAVRAYEAGTRARKTILNRITQLQKG